MKKDNTGTQFEEVKDKILVSLCTISVGIFAWIAVSVTELNKNVAAVVTKVEEHENRLNRYEVRIMGVEARK